MPICDEEHEKLLNTIVVIPKRDDPYKYNLEKSLNRIPKMIMRRPYLYNVSTNLENKNLYHQVSMFNIETLDHLKRVKLEDTESSNSIGDAPATYFDQNFSLLPSLGPQHIQKKEVSVQLPVPQY